MTDDTGNRPQSADLDRERLLNAIARFEAELDQLPPTSPQAVHLRHDIDKMKQHLDEPGSPPDSLRDSWQSLRDRLENEVLRDSPYLSEIGRIIGLV